MATVPHRVFEVEGEWWLPGKEGRRVPGRLRFDPEGGGELRLIGTFRSMFEGGERRGRDGSIVVSYTRESIERDGTYPRILGLANGWPYTLEDCFQTNARRFLTGGTETITVGQIYRGVHVEPGEIPSGNAVSADLRYLTHWIGQSAIGESRTSPTASLSSFDKVTLYAAPVDDQAARLADGSMLRLTHTVRVHGDRLISRGLSQRFYFRMDTPEVVGTEALVERISDLQDLVSIATDRTAEIDGMRFWHPDINAETGEGEKFPRHIQFFARWNNRDGSKTPGSLELARLYFTFEQFGGIEGVGRWLDRVAPHRSALGRVVSSYQAPSMFTSDRLLNTAAALESFDRVRHGNDIFHRRMARCVSVAGDPFRDLIGNDVDGWIKAVKSHRNDIAHHLGTHVKQSNSAQFFLAKSLYWLFVLCLISEAEAPKVVFDQISKHDKYQFLGHRIRAAIA
jgi:hypothetical protein